MDAVTSIDAPSLLFLCSRIKRLGDRSVLVSGTYPVGSAKAQATLYHANFNDFLAGRVERAVLHDRHLQLVEGTDRRVLPEVGLKIRSFIEVRHSALGQEELDFVYVAVAECLENVKDHAYRGLEAPPHARRWYAIGLYDDEHHTSVVSILDQGRGVATTARDQLPALRRIVTSNEDILQAATSGQLTRTGERKRGKGFLSLRDFALRAPNRRFHVISDGAMITWSHGAAAMKRKVPDVGGTVVCLEIANAVAA